MNANLLITTAMDPLTQRLHQKALAISKCFQQIQTDLLKILQEIEEKRIFLKLGYPSLFAYAVQELKLSEANACTFITVARKGREIPALQEELEAGHLSVHKARRLTPILTQENAKQWLEKACKIPQKALEREIARVAPEKELPNHRFHFVNGERVNLELGISEDLMQKLIRVQDVLSQKKKQHVRLEEAVEFMSKEFLQRHDPIEKHKRRQARKAKQAAKKQAKNAPEQNKGPKAKTVESKNANSYGARHTGAFFENLDRHELKQILRQEVAWRDQGRCTYKHANGKRCKQSRWLEIHHIFPVSKGGDDRMENLTTLCSSHHKLMHYNDYFGRKAPKPSPQMPLLAG